jgi:hypothetical protein
MLGGEDDDLMARVTMPAPLHLAKLFGVRTSDIAIQLRVTPDWLRQLARKPHYATRIRVAELEAILQQQKLTLLAESLMSPSSRYTNEATHGT